MRTIRAAARALITIWEARTEPVLFVELLSAHIPWKPSPEANSKEPSRSSGPASNPRLKTFARQPMSELHSDPASWANPHVLEIPARIASELLRSSCDGE